MGTYFWVFLGTDPAIAHKIKGLKGQSPNLGARKGERLIEPLWLEEEKPTPTDYPKILQLENKEYADGRLDTLLQKLYPICFYTQGQEADFRNKEKLVSLLCDDCQSLKDFYEEIKTDGQKRTDIL